MKKIHIELMLLLCLVILFSCANTGKQQTTLNGHWCSLDKEMDNEYIEVYIDSALFAFYFESIGQRLPWYYSLNDSSTILFATDEGDTIHSSVRYEFKGSDSLVLTFGDTLSNYYLKQPYPEHSLSDFLHGEISEETYWSAFLTRKEGLEIDKQ